MTGMGHDGLAGVQQIKAQKNSYCLTQSEKSCIVYGMPRAIVENGLSDETLDLDKIASRITTLLQGGKAIWN